jgi:4-oxalocrotonate tautomerase
MSDFSSVRHSPPRVKRTVTTQFTGESKCRSLKVRVIKDVFSKDQKRQIIKKLTDAMVSIEGENMRGVTWVRSRKSRAATGASVGMP